MAMTPPLAGLLTGIFLGLTLGLFLYLRRKRFVALFSQDADVPHLSEQTWGLIFGGSMLVAASLFGVLAGWVYERVRAWSDNAPFVYLLGALGLMLVLCVLAALGGPRRVGMLLETLVINGAFGLGFGLFVPLLVEVWPSITIALPAAMGCQRCASIWLGL